MKVFDGQSTASPWTPAKSSAASAAPAQPPKATEPRPFQAAQASSKRLGHLALGPALGGDDVVPQIVEPGKVAAIEPDRELTVGAVGHGLGEGVQVFREDELGTGAAS